MSCQSQQHKEERPHIERTNERTSERTGTLLSSWFHTKQQIMNTRPLRYFSLSSLLLSHTLARWRSSWRTVAVVTKKKFQKHKFSSYLLYVCVCVLVSVVPIAGLIRPLTSFRIARFSLHSLSQTVSSVGLGRP